MSRKRLLGVSVAFGLGLAALVGCGQKQPEAQASAAPPAAAAPAAGLPSGHPPVPPGQAAPGAGMAGGFEIAPPPAGAGAGSAQLTWQAPADWKSEAPSSGMRKAQYKVPGPGGDAECVVFYFGPGQGGDAMSNAGRWAAQFLDEKGNPVAMPKTDTIDVGGLTVMRVEAKGTYVGGMGSAAGQHPGYMLLGGVAEGPDANWFFKLTGPEKTVEAQRAGFETLLKSLKKGS